MPPIPPPRDFDDGRRLVLAGLGCVLVGLVILALLRTRQETLLFDVASGRLRIERALLGYRYHSEPIVSHIEWVGVVLAGSVPQRWVVVHQRQHGSLILRNRHHRRLGQVHLEAVTLARVLHLDPLELRAVLRRIATAEAEDLIELRQSLRTAFNARHEPSQSFEP